MPLVWLLASGGFPAAFVLLLTTHLASSPDGSVTIQ
jgi:hypothetical protein